MEREPSSRVALPGGPPAPTDAAPGPNKVTLVTETLEVSSLDNRSYRVILLRNGLEALLAHDPDADMASASLDVGVGSFSEDPDMPGLAHALEHVLFMGSKKYPEANSFDQYITSHAGTTNASTARTSTNYYFRVSAKPGNSDEAASAMNPSPLRSALDRFAQFFISPMFLASSVDRELQSVDSEFSKSRQIDDYRLWQLRSELSHPGHPFHKFTMGNLDTLKAQPELRNINPRDRMIEFYEKHYSADRMKLAVLGSEPLGVLEAWVSVMFSPVPNKGLPTPRWQEVDPFGPEQLSMLCFAKPVADLMELRLTFPMIDPWTHFESWPSYLLSHLIGHEGPGSIFSYIKSKGWANSLRSWGQSICAGSPGLFSCNITLTEEGLKNYWEIVTVFFQYLSLLRESPATAQALIFEERKRMSDINFNFEEKSSPEQFTSDVARRMQQPIPRPWLLSISKLRKFDPEAIRSSLDYLRPENVLITVVSRTITDKWDREERWYGTEYSLVPISPDRMAKIQTAFSATALDRIAALCLPPNNSFIPAKLEVEKMPIAVPSVAPRIIRNNDLVRTWFKKDDSFRVPKAHVIVLFRSPLPSAASRVEARLFRDLVNDALGEDIYEAKQAGLDYKLLLDCRGLELHVSGYGDKLPALLERILIRMRDCDLEDRFDTTKEQLNRHYHNLLLEEPYRQLNGLRGWLTSDNYPVPEFLAELPSITAEATTEFRRKFLSQMHMEILVHGNLGEQAALTLTDALETIFKPRVLEKPQRPTIRSIVFPPGSNYLFEDVLQDPGNVDHAITVCLYIGNRKDHALRARTWMAYQMVKQPVFTQLGRTEQLGYITWTELWWGYTTLGIRFTIQSRRHDPRHLDARLENLLASFARTLADMSNADFEKHKRSLIALLLKKEKNLDEETGRLWDHIDDEGFEFDTAQVDAALVTQLTKADMIEFYNCYFDPRSSLRAKLSIHLVAQPRSDADQVLELLKGLDLKDEAATGAATEVLQAALSAEAHGDGAQNMERIRASLLSLAVAEDKVTALIETLSKEHDGSSAQSVPNNGITPILIKNVNEFKAGLQYTPATEPFRNLNEYVWERQKEGEKA